MAHKLTQSNAQVNIQSLELPGVPEEDKRRLLKSPLLSGLPAEVTHQMLASGKMNTLKRGELLFMDGDEVQGFSFILAGKLKEYFPTSDGTEVLRRILFPGNYISLHKIFKRESRYTYFGEAVCSMRFFSWPRESFTALMTTQPALSINVAEVLSEYVESSYRHNCLCRKTLAIAKVAGYLLKKSLPTCQDDLCYCDVQHTPCKADLRPLNLAAMDVCLARETFSRALSSLQEKGHIRVKNGVADILDVEELKRISGVV